MVDHSRKGRHETYRRRYAPDAVVGLEAAIEEAVDRLRSAYAATDPTGAGSNRRRKRNDDSWKALAAVGTLLDGAAGWAVDHEIGKAANDIGDFISVRPDPSKRATAKAAERFDQLAPRVNSKRMEEVGADIRRDHHLIDDRSKGYQPEVQRQMLINVLRPIAATANIRLLHTLVEALEALNMGETYQLLTADAGPRRSFTLAMLKVHALRYIEYQVARWGKAKAVVIEDVLNAYGRAGSDRKTISNWKKQVECRLGTVAVAQQLEAAAKVGKWCRSISPGPIDPESSLSSEQLDVLASDEIFGLEQLKRRGDTFRQG